MATSSGVAALATVIEITARARSRDCRGDIVRWFIRSSSLEWRICGKCGDAMHEEFRDVCVAPLKTSLPLKLVPFGGLGSPRCGVFLDNMLFSTTRLGEDKPDL